jgi:hypothetical protein
MPEPFDDYLQALRSAADLYQADRPASRIAQVSATISFLRAMNVDPALYTPLLNVLGQLEDEQQGRTGHSTATLDAANMGAAAAVITLAMRAGKTREQAAKLVAGSIGLDAHKPAEVKRLLQYRKNLMDRGSPATAAHVYGMVIQQARKSGVSPQDALQLGLDLLRGKVTATTT